MTYEVQARNDESSSDWSESGRGCIAVFVSIHEPQGPVREGSSVDLPVSLSSPMSVEVTVSWHTVGQPSFAPANEAVGALGTSDESVQSPEHEPSSGTISFSAGETSASIRITIMDDEEHEDLESFRIVLDWVTVSSPYQVQIDEGMAPVSILDDDAPPVFTHGETNTRSVAENTPPGRPIGPPITATDAEDDPLKYTLSGADARAFTLDSITGLFRTSAPLD